MTEEQATIEQVKKYTRAFEVYELVQTFFVYRNDSNGDPREIRIEIWRGEDGYHVNSKDCNDLEDSSNPYPTVSAALLGAHWGKYDKPTPEP